MTDNTSQSNLARRLLRSVDSGILSTMSKELPGYPFGSVTPFVMTHDGKIVIYVSAIAQHTANLLANPKTCLTAMQSGGGNQQELGRVTVVADAAEVPEDRIAEVQQRYYTFFPESQHYGQAHNFAFYWLEPVRVRYIGGFGKIFWIEQQDWALAEPEWQEAEAGIVKHMNDDHGEALRNMARHFCGMQVDQVEQLAVDVEGCHIRVGSEVRYLPFEAPCTTMNSVRAAMVSLAKIAAPK